MSDVQWLFVVLAILYGWECLCWLRRGGVAFSSWLGRRWRVQHPGTLAGNQAGGFVIASPLLPLGSLFIANQIPVSLAPDGVLGFVSPNVNPGWRPAQSGRSFNWREMREVRVRGRKVLINGELLLTAATTSLARHFSSTVKQLAALQPAERAAAIAELTNAALDTEAIETRLAEWTKRARPVRWLANLLVIFIFGVAPGLIWQFGFLRCWLGLLLGLLALTLTTAILFARAHRALYPGTHDERFTLTLTIALAPTSAMRAHDALSRPLLETFHPLAVAATFLKDRAFNEFARRVLIDLRYPALPLCPNAPPGAAATEQFFRQTLLAATEQFLTRHGVKPTDLCRPPAPADTSSLAYCPRCEAQFTKVTGRCADCGGLPLVAFYGTPA